MTSPAQHVPVRVKTVLVFGSINMDLVVQTPRFLQPGETLTGNTFYTAPGGKGANQAVAAARLGAPTRMIGRVGRDVFGPSLLESLRTNGVDTITVSIDTVQPSGIAHITVDQNAENIIIIIPGANGQMGMEDVARLEGLLPQGGALLLQLEIPLPAVLAAAKLAHSNGLAVILDPAPAIPLPEELYRLIDWITPNESEAAALVGFPIQTEAEAARAASALHERGVPNVVIKMGGRGAYLSAGAGAGRLLPPFKVNPIDTVAAGDAFNGALAAALVADLPVEQAMRWAMGAGALSTTKPGAQPSMPTLAELESFLAANP